MNNTTDIVYYPHAIYCTVYGGSELFTLSVLNDVEPSHNFSDLTEHAAGQVAPFLTGSHMASPDNRFSTPQLTTLLAVTIAGDYYIARNLGSHTTDILYRAGVNLGTRVARATTGHVRMRADRNSMLVVESITCRDGGLADARCRLVHVLNSATGADPLVPVAGVALSGLATGGLLHTLGPMALNGTALKGVTDWTLDFNVEYDAESSHGDGFPTWCCIKRYRPVWTIHTRSTQYVATFGSRGTALSSLLAYTRAKQASGINYADAAEYHIGFSSSNGTIKARKISGDKAQCEITVDCNSAAEDTAAVAIAVNQAIA
jgi:hypothetical protein